MDQSLVIRETDNYARSGSRADRYYRRYGIQNYMKYIAPGQKLVPALQSDDAPEMLKQHYNLQSLYFGNWVTNEDRHNYIHLLDLSFSLLNSVLKFKNNNIGLGILSISIGGRGRGKALAHYEPTTFIINVTRYQNGSESKEARLAATGGISSLAHEYGHFLDYTFGRLWPDAGSISLSGGHRIARNKLYGTNAAPARIAADNLMHAIFWKDKAGQTESDYVKRLRKAAPPDKNEYWHRRNEVFARCFEAFISYALRQKKSGLIIMADKSYDKHFYPTDKEMKRLVPYFNKLIALFRNSSILKHKKK